MLDDISKLIQTAGIDLQSPKQTNPFSELSSLLHVKYDIAEARILGALRDSKEAVESRLKIIYNTIEAASTQAKMAARIAQTSRGYTTSDVEPLKILAETLQEHYGAFVEKYTQLQPQS